MDFEDLSDWFKEDSLEEVVGEYTYNQALEIFNALQQTKYKNLNSWYVNDARGCCIVINGILPVKLAWSYDR